MKQKPVMLIILLILFFIIMAEIKFLSGGLLSSVLPSYVRNGESIELLEPEEPEPEDFDYSAADFPIPDLNITKENIFTINNFDIVRNNLYNIDSSAYVYDEDIDFNRLLGYDLRVSDLYGNNPKILIFHTHSREAFADSRSGVEADTIVGVGAYLAEVLRAHGITVVHHKGVFDMLDGQEVRNGSYERMEPVIKQILKDNPSIEVVIDLHRDYIPSGRLLKTEINGRETAQIMFFNGICRENKNGEPKETDWLVNEYLEENLSFSLQMKLLANEMYPGFARKNYIRPYRYSLHMKPKSLLIEVGATTNTVAEAKNAMVPLAAILARALH
jgi:stage II sporulation protein P